MFRQGDILLAPVAEIPEGAVPRPPDGSRAVVAYGEATGHAHAFDADEAQLWDGSDGTLYAVVTGRQSAPWPYARLLGEDPTSFTVEGPAGVVVFGKAHARYDGTHVQCSPFALFRHEEHFFQAVPSGVVQIRRQREYDDAGEIRVVAD